MGAGGDCLLNHEEPILSYYMYGRRVAWFIPPTVQNYWKATINQYI